MSSWDPNQLVPPMGGTLWMRLRQGRDEDLRHFLVEEIRRTRHTASDVLRDLIEEARVARSSVVERTA